MDKLFIIVGMFCWMALAFMNKNDLNEIKEEIKESKNIFLDKRVYKCTELTVK